MIPQNIKDIVSSEQYTGFFQTLALILFLIFFIGVVIYVFSRSKKHYDDVAHAPLDDEEKPFDL